MKTILSLCAVSMLGCAARTAEMYEADTRKLLESNTSPIKACYDGLLKSNNSAKGTVVVSFTVAMDTGAITGATANAEKSTAPKEIQACVVQSLGGLKLDPPDAREGQATFTWELDIAPGSSSSAPSGFTTGS